MMEAKQLKKIASLHLLGVVVIFLGWAIFFSFSLSLEQKDGNTGGESLGSSFTTIGPWRVEYMEFRGAGSGEFGGCARNIFSEKNNEFLVGIDRGCLNSGEMTVVSLFLGIIYSPLVLLLSLPLLIIGRRKNNPYLIHLGMLALDLFILFLLGMNSGAIPVFNFEQPFHGRTLG
jgi:hypothetical protein